MTSESFLSRLVQPVMGCTEPAALSLTVALATHATAAQWPSWVNTPNEPLNHPPMGWPSPEDIELVDLRTTRNLFKNAMAVGLPNTQGQSGIPLAAALGAYLSPEDGLNLLKRTDLSILANARGLLGRGRVEVEVDERDEEIFIECRVIAIVAGERHVGEAIIRGRHDGLVLLRRDGRRLYEADAEMEEANATCSDLRERSWSDLLARVRTLSAEDRSLALQGARLNREAAHFGLEKRLGLGVGAALRDLLAEGRLGSGPVTQARILTAAACDARMSGYELEVMASGGSGNQGLIATLPALALAEDMRMDEDRLASALALGHLLTHMMTQGAGLLGGMCGCVIKAGVGSAAACAYLLSDDPVVIEASVNNMAGNIVGEICDGAKVGCAMKLATAAGVAVEAALLASKGVSVPPSNGIIGRRAFETLHNIGALSQSMRGVDRRIVEVMRAKV